jgi:outer membrane protein assembly factor BamD
MRFLSFLIIASLLLSCTSVPDRQASPGKLYQAAMQDVHRGRYEAAIEKLQQLRSSGNDLQRQQAEVGLAYAYYKSDNPEQALLELQDFIARHPDYPQMDYAIYLRGLIHLKQGVIHLEALRQTLAPQQDYPEELRKAYADFSLLIRRFPQSRYVEPAYKYIETIRRQLAEYELQQARYQLISGDYDEVIRRTRYVEEYYNIPEVTRQALELQLKAYQALDKKNKIEMIKRRLQTLGET